MPTIRQFQLFPPSVGNSNAFVGRKFAFHFCEAARSTDKGENALDRSAESVNCLRSFLLSAARRAPERPIQSRLSQKLGAITLSSEKCLIFSRAEFSIR